MSTRYSLTCQCKVNPNDLNLAYIGALGDFYSSYFDEIKSLVKFIASLSEKQLELFDSAEIEKNLWYCDSFSIHDVIEFIEEHKDCKEFVILSEYGEIKNIFLPLLSH